MKISKEFKIAVVVLGAIGAFVWGLNFLKGTNLFTKKYYLYAIYPQIDGLIEANPLMVKGFKIGQVNKISLIKQQGEYHVLVRFLITEEVNIPEILLQRQLVPIYWVQKQLKLFIAMNQNLFHQAILYCQLLKKI